MSTETKTIFVDESGYTGFDLLNADQPAFALASLQFSEEESRELRHRFFGAVGSAELKHSRLRRRPNRQALVVDFLEHLSENSSAFKIAAVHKRFALVCKMVDLLVEPSMRKHGYDAYQDGANLALANITFYIVKSLSPAGFWDHLLSTFQHFVCNPTHETARDLYDVLDDVSAPPPLVSVLQYYKLAIRDLGPGVLSTLSCDCLDVALTCALNLMACWRAATTSRLELIHDASSKMAEQRDLWEATMDPTLQPVTVGYDRRTMRYPIAVHRTMLESSQQWAGLQLADVVAGAVAHALRHRTPEKGARDAYAERIISIIDRWSVPVIVWPELKVTPEELGTIGARHVDPVEHTCRILREKVSRLTARCPGLVPDGANRVAWIGLA